MQRSSSQQCQPARNMMAAIMTAAMTASVAATMTATAIIAISFGIGGYSTSAYAAWNAGGDEANRQRAMQRMRDDANRADRVSNERASRQMADNERANRANNRSSNSSNATGNRTSSGPYYGGGYSDNEDSAPQSVVDRKTIIIQTTLSTNQVIAKAKREAESGDAEAQNRFGQMYFSGAYVTRDENQARRWFGEAAKRGLATAQGAYGYMLKKGLGGEADLVEATKWLKKGAEGGDTYSESQYGMAIIMEQAEAIIAGTNKPAEMKRAEQFLTRAAEKGDIGAQAALADMYKGYGDIVRDDIKAVRWLKASADQGFAYSMKELAAFYLQGGGGLKADPKTALQWLQKAVALKEPGAMRNLAGYYQSGEAGLSPSMEKAIALIKESADLGDAQSMSHYGMLQITGQAGVAKDVPAGVALVKRAAEANNHVGLDDLARLHIDGLGVTQDYKQAVILLRRSIDMRETPDPDSLALLATPELMMAAKSVDAVAKR